MGVVPALGRVSSSLEYATSAREFASYCKFLLACRGDRIAARAMAEAAGASERVQTILKTAVSAGSTSTLGALNDYRIAVGGFLSTLRGYSAFDTILPSTMQLPLHTRVAVSSVAITGTRVGEMSAKPISA